MDDCTFWYTNEYYPPTRPVQLAHAHRQLQVRRRAGGSPTPTPTPTRAPTNTPTKLRHQRSHQYAGPADEHAHEYADNTDTNTPPLRHRPTPAPPTNTPTNTPTPTPTEDANWRTADPDSRLLSWALANRTLYGSRSAKKSAPAQHRDQRDVPKQDGQDLLDHGQYGEHGLQGDASGLQQ